MKELGRRSPTILNIAWSDLLFWDGRAATLELQALGPIASQREMNQPLDGMIRTLDGIPEYKPLFLRAYADQAIDEKTVARAIATFERTVVSGQAPFDKWIAGDEDAIPSNAKRGFDLFNSKAACSSATPAGTSPMTGFTISVSQLPTWDAGHACQWKPCSSRSKHRRSETSTAALHSCTTVRNRRSETSLIFTTKADKLNA